MANCWPRPRGSARRQARGTMGRSHGWIRRRRARRLGWAIAVDETFLLGKWLGPLCVGSPLLSLNAHGGICLNPPRSGHPDSGGNGLGGADEHVGFGDGAGRSRRRSTGRRRGRRGSSRRAGRIRLLNREVAQLQTPHNLLMSVPHHFHVVVNGAATLGMALGRGAQLHNVQPGACGIRDDWVATLLCWVAMLWFKQSIISTFAP